MLKKLRNKIEDTMMTIDNKRLEVNYKVLNKTPINVIDAVDDLAYVTDKVKNKIKRK